MQGHPEDAGGAPAPVGDEARRAIARADQEPTVDAAGARGRRSTASVRRRESPGRRRVGRAQGSSAAARAVPKCPMASRVARNGPAA